jgi:hypothetical protein
MPYCHHALLARAAKIRAARHALLARRAAMLRRRIAIAIIAVAGSYQQLPYVAAAPALRRNRYVAIVICYPRQPLPPIPRRP